MSETPEGSPVVIAVRDQDTDERLVYETGLTGWWDIEAGQFVIPFTTRENAADCLKIIAASVTYPYPPRKEAE